jgi:hypothetical protein
MTSGASGYFSTDSNVASQEEPMSNRIPSRSRGVSAARSITAVGLAGALLLWPAIGVSAPGGPFGPFLGSWRGSGQVTAEGGHTERINCRATYSASESGAALTQSLVCASDSYRFDVQCYVEANGHSLRGHWQETTRNASGSLTGQITGGDFEGTVAGAGFTAGITIRSNERRQVVDIKPSAGGITDVQVALARVR